MKQGLKALENEAKRDLQRLNWPAPNWVIAQPAATLDVLVVGGGMCGQTATFALLREGVRSLRCIDRAPRGSEGPWTTFARMYAQLVTAIFLGWLVFGQLPDALAFVGIATIAASGLLLILAHRRNSGSGP